MMYKNSRWLVFLFAICLQWPAFVLADTVQVAATSDGKALAQSLYCDTFSLLSGDIGLLVGLALAAAGFISLLFQGLSFSTIFLILTGIFITALPGWFASGIDGMAGMFSGGTMQGHSPNATGLCGG